MDGVTRVETPEQRDFLDHGQCPRCGSDNVSWDRLEEAEGVAYQRFSCAEYDCEVEGCVDFVRVGHTIFRYGTTPTGRQRRDPIYRSETP